MAHVEIDQAVKCYDAFRALDGVSLKVPSGAFFTLLGPSGCGKTTLLRALAGFHHLDSGDLRIDGASLIDTPPHQRNIGMVFQDYAVFPHLSVEENVAFGLKRQRLPSSEFKRRLDGILGVVQLESLRQRMPHELSGGQQQRVGLARSLVMNPGVILMDEPLSNLDAQLREELRTEIRGIQQQLGITTIYVTHDQEEALAVSDLICVLNEGQVQQIGTPLEVYRDPANLFVASFVGGNNFLEPDAPALQAARASNRSLSPPPQGATATIRPEQISLAPERVAASDLRLLVTLEQVNFFGREYHLIARTSDQAPLKIILPMGDGTTSLNSGQQVEVGMNERDFKYFENSPAGSRIRSRP